MAHPHILVNVRPQLIVAMVQNALNGAGAKTMSNLLDTLPLNPMKLNLPPNLIPMNIPKRALPFTLEDAMLTKTADMDLTVPNGAGAKNLKETPMSNKMFINRPPLLINPRLLMEKIHTMILM